MQSGNQDIRVGNFALRGLTGSCLSLSLFITSAGKSLHQVLAILWEMTGKKALISV